MSFILALLLAGAPAPSVPSSNPPAAQDVLLCSGAPSEDGTVPCRMVATTGESPPKPRFYFNMELAVTPDAYNSLCESMVAANPDHATRYERLRAMPHELTTYEMAELAALATLDELVARGCSGHAEEITLPEEDKVPVPVT